MGSKQNFNFDIQKELQHYSLQQLTTTLLSVRPTVGTVAPACAADDHIAVASRPSGHHQPRLPQTNPALENYGDTI
jgi:hypothetical protein